MKRRTFIAGLCALPLVKWMPEETEEQRWVREGRERYRNEPWKWYGVSGIPNYPKGTRFTNARTGEEYIATGR